MQNPFALLSQTGRSALCPWKQGQHIDYYSSVDHIASAIQEFQKAMTIWNPAAAGNFVFVCGEAGCGKSSLIHRCTHILHQRISTHDEQKIWIVDLMEEPHPDGAQAKTKHAFSLLRDQISQHKDFLDVDKSSICDPSVELTLAGSRLSSRLTQYKVVLILLAPQVKSDAEFKEMLSLFYRPQICTFVEAVDTSLMEFCHRHHSTGSSRPVIKLSIGGVAQKDGIEYKNDRIELLRRQNPANVIEFPDSVMRHFFAERMSNSIGMSVLELERVCRHAFERARLRGDTKIEYSDLVNFYMAYFHGT